MLGRFVYLSSAEKQLFLYVVLSLSHNNHVRQRINTYYSYVFYRTRKARLQKKLVKVAIKTTMKRQLLMLSASHKSLPLLVMM